ncbi:transposase [Saccharopolyspora hattusasensis]|uniref:transposase n=1 Tax=Saccharopolyspora hattusasensis TaxID=1128679 RepID=UPI003D987192
MYFTVYTGSFNAGVFVPFLDSLTRHLDSLTRHLDRTVQVIVDGRPVHRRKTVRKWVDDHAAAIGMHFLPGYSPELNPDEIQGADLKRTMTTGTASKTRDELKQAARSFLHRANPKSATPPETTHLPYESKKRLSRGQYARGS